MIKTLILLTVFVFSTSLTAQNNEIKDKLIPKEKIGVHNRNFKLGGFYYSKRMQVRFDNDTARYIHPFIFFKDGLLVGFDFIGNSSSDIKINQKGKRCTLKPRQDFETILAFFKCYAETAKREKTYTVYSIDKNIIRIQSIDANLNFFGEGQGVVYNDSTFVITKSINHLTNVVEEKNDIYHFHASPKPDSTHLKPSPDIKKYFFRD